MTIEYARAYSRERQELAQLKRRQAAAAADRVRSLDRIRDLVGRSLIAVGERLSPQPLGEAPQAG